MSVAHNMRIWNVVFYLDAWTNDKLSPVNCPVLLSCFNEKLCFVDELPYISTPSNPCGEYTYLGPGNSVGIATDYRLDGSGSNPGGGRDFPPVQTGPGAHPASSTMGTGSFPWVKCGRGMLLTTHPLLVPRSGKSRAIPLPTLWATPGL